MHDLLDFKRRMRERMMMIKYPKFMNNTKQHVNKQQQQKNKKTKRHR